MRKYTKSLIVILIFAIVGCGLGFYLNNLNNRLQTTQIQDYLHRTTNSHWYLAIPVFALLIGLIVVGYLFGKKVKDSDI